MNCKRLALTALTIMLAGCAVKTEVSTAFKITTTSNSDCVWVIRNNAEWTETPWTQDVQGQSYLYLCCPSPEEGRTPVCLTPRWSQATNNLRITDPAPPKSTK